MSAPTPIKSPGNYLTKFALEQENRKWERRKCAVLVNIIFALKGVRRISKAQLRVLNISPPAWCVEGSMEIERASYFVAKHQRLVRQLVSYRAKAVGAIESTVAIVAVKPPPQHIVARIDLKIIALWRNSVVKIVPDRLESSYKRMGCV